MSAVIVWFRQDLRLTDNPALQAASSYSLPIIPLYILDETSPKERKLGGAQRWWLYQSLQALKNDFQKLNLPLILKKGESLAVLQEIIQRTHAKVICWNHCYEPFAQTRDNKIKKFFEKSNIEVKTFNSALLQEPKDVLNKQQQPFKVFTPFWKACCKQYQPTPLLLKPTYLIPPDKKVIEYLKSNELHAWQLLPTKPNWASAFEQVWQPGEIGAEKALQTFLQRGLRHYAHDRDRLDKSGTSMLSPHLHFGEISPRQIWAAVKQEEVLSMIPQVNIDRFLAELGWREFSYHLLFYYPQLPEKNFRPNFDRFQWRNNPQDLQSWQRGETGYPVVDAGMRQLWQIGYMHNRVRMVVASFLIKHLLIHWTQGEKWFWDTLVDADLANNAASWQWVAGSGVDAAPYFRIFNPVLQGEKFDPEGDYVRQWIPELKEMPTKFIHCPWKAPDNFRVKNYPAPIVEHNEARLRALEIYQSISSKGKA